MCLVQSLVPGTRWLKQLELTCTHGLLQKATWLVKQLESHLHHGYLASGFLAYPGYKFAALVDRFNAIDKLHNHSQMLLEQQGKQAPQH